MKRLSITTFLALLGAGVAFLLGWAIATFGAPPDEVFLTDTWSFRPAEQPLAHGLYYVAWVGILEIGILLGVWLTILLTRLGLLFHVVAIGLTCSGLFGATAALFGSQLGFSGNQRGSMAVVAVTLGGMGALMCAALVKERMRRPRK